MTFASRQTSNRFGTLEWKSLRIYVNDMKFTNLYCHIDYNKQMQLQQQNYIQKKLFRIPFFFISANNTHF